MYRYTLYMHIHTYTLLCACKHTHIHTQSDVISKRENLTMRLLNWSLSRARASLTSCQGYLIPIAFFKLVVLHLCNPSTTKANVDFKTRMKFVVRPYLKTLKSKTSNNSKSSLSLSVLFPPLSKDLSKFLKDHL